MNEMVSKPRDEVWLLDPQTFARRHMASKCVTRLRHATVLVGREAKGSHEVHATATTD